MFHFTRFLPRSRGRLDCSSQVAPFGDLRITERLLLTGAFRSLPRPSSADGAKAFTVCPYHLFLSYLSFPFSVVNVQGD